LTPLTDLVPLWLCARLHPFQLFGKHYKSPARPILTTTYLNNNDVTALFAATDDLVLTRPTLTNTHDIRVILVDQT
jgi:hypothetical protein